MKLTPIYISWLLMLLALPRIAAAAENSEKQAEESNGAPLSPEAVVKSLIEKGHLEEAASLIDKIDGNDYAISCYKGIIALKRDAPEEAIGHFQKAAELDGSKPELYLFLSQAHYQTGDLKKTLGALVKGEAAGKMHASYYLFRGHIEMSLEAFESSHDTLVKGLMSFPAEARFQREIAVVLIRAGFYATAVAHAEEYIAKAPSDKEGFLVIAHALREAGRPKEAAGVLEEVNLRYHEDPAILSALGYAYGHAGWHGAAARYLEKAALLDASHAFDAAEHYMSAGRWKKASEMNLLVSDRQKCLSQRLSLYLRQGRFERAAVIGEKLGQEGMLEDRDRYCLAFAYIQLGHLTRAAASTEAIETSKWKTMAAALLRDANRRRPPLE